MKHLQLLILSHSNFVLTKARRLHWLVIHHFRLPQIPTTFHHSSPKMLCPNSMLLKIKLIRPLIINLKLISSKVFFRNPKINFSLRTTHQISSYSLLAVILRISSLNNLTATHLISRSVSNRIILSVHSIISLKIHNNQLVGLTSAKQ
jgi:hypothetical protein